MATCQEKEINPADGAERLQRHQRESPGTCAASSKFFFSFFLPSSPPLADKKEINKKFSPCRVAISESIDTSAFIRRSITRVGIYTPTINTKVYQAPSYSSPPGRLLRPAGRRSAIAQCSSLYIKRINFRSVLKATCCLRLLGRRVALPSVCVRVLRHDDNVGAH